MSQGLLRYWVSWNEPFEVGKPADCRPLTVPLPKSIPHWWCSGEGDGYFTMCAVVDVNGTEASAKEEIQRFWRPSEWRFTTKKGWTKDAWLPPDDRFPVRRPAADV